MKTYYQTIYRLCRPHVFRYYKSFVQGQYDDVALLQSRQAEALRVLLAHACETVPYYRELYKKGSFPVRAVSNVDELQRLPVTPKQAVRHSTEAFRSSKPDSHIIDTTGGSTGVPLRYLMSRGCYDRGVALLYRGWALGGYQLGDRLFVLAGGSLASRHFSLRDILQMRLTNTTRFSSYGIGTSELERYVRILKQRRPRFLRGYASSIYLLAKHILQEGVKLDSNPQAAFCTSEMLLPGQRQVMEEAFCCPVFDNYGLNDGGVSAYECRYHKGLHIDSERSILEVVDEDGRPVYEREGRILATSLYNFAMPFIRYETGDIGVMSKEVCRCGIRRPLLQSIRGRTTDFLVLNGRAISGPQLTILMGKLDVEWYQFVQKGGGSVLLRVVAGKGFGAQQKKAIEKSLYTNVGPFRLEFEMLPSPPACENKHHFIINDSVEALGLSSGESVASRSQKSYV
jgi:phenylacetate-CoA ligase